MDKKQRDLKPVKKKSDSDSIPTNGIVEEDGKAYIWCGETKVLLPGGYVKLKS